MTTSSRRSPRMLLIATVVLAVTGMFLLSLPEGKQGPSAAPSVATATVPTTAPALVTGSGPAKAGTPTAATAPSPSAPPSASALPPHGEGVAGDREIQKALQAAWPADLPADDERELLTAGRELLRADATGISRTQWPHAFGDGDRDRAVAPAFATSHFRVQAAIARRDGSPDRAVVHLVWAGADRGGTYTDCRITDLYFTRTSTKGASTWTPQPRI